MRTLLFCFVLLANVVFSQTIVPGGLVSGTWTLAGSPYLVQGSIQISNGTTLIIEPGVNVVFQGSFKLNVQGRILAIGTLSDSISFMPSDTTIGWLGIRFSSTPTINDSSKITYSKILYANVSEGYTGGGISIDFFDKILISNCLISNCKSQWGGGAIFCNETEASILNNKIIKNSSISPGNGGGICCINYSIPYIANNFISNNTSFNGGGICICGYPDNPKIENNIISNNIAIYGGGIMLADWNSCPTITSSTIVNNSAQYGGGVFAGGGNSPSFINCILWGNTSSTSGNQVFLNYETSDPNFYYCNIEGGTSAFGLNSNIYTGNYQNNINSNPLFVSPSAGSGTGYNGLTANWSLQSGSPCINTGDPLIYTPATDIAGNPRAVVCLIDMGAYEYQSGAPFLLSIVQTVTIPCNSYLTGALHANVSGGTLPYNYIWSNGGTNVTISNVSAGTYSVTVNDAAGCVRIDTMLITEPAGMTLTPSATNIDCSGNCTGTANVGVSGGSTPYSYLWSTTIPQTTATTTSILCSGTYTVTVTDDQGCSMTSNAIVSTPSSLSFTTTVNNVNCYGQNNGNVLVNSIGGSGTLQYSKDGGLNYQLSNNFTGLAAGTYNIVVKDANGCQTSVISISVSEPTMLTGTDSQINVSCYGASNGSATINVTGGSPSYIYSWNTTSSQTTPTAANLPIGNYNVTVTDLHGCSIIQSFSIISSIVNIPMCLVTVDTITWKNKIMWEKNGISGVLGFNIFKEVGTGIYTGIGYVPLTDPAIYVDFASSPESFSNRYKISVLDTCGSESTKSFYHKTVNLTIAAFGSTMGLNWNDYVDEGGAFVPVNYYIYRGVTPSSMQLLDSVPGGTNSYNDNNVFNLYYYIIGVKKAGGCNTNKSDFVSFSNKKDNSTLLGISNATYGTMNVFPNPFSDFTTITIPNYQPSINNNQLVLTDVTGKIVRKITNINSVIAREGLTDAISTPQNQIASNPTGSRNDAQLVIERGNLIPGVYFVELRGDKVYRGKLILE